MILRTFLGLTFLTLLISSQVLATPAVESANEPMWPGSNYRSDIPTFKQVLNYDVGERITNHADMLRYFEALANAAPNKIKIFEYGRTWEGRKLIYVAIGNSKNIADLSSFADNMRKLADPRLTNKKQANSLFNTLPSSVWLQYGVHGNEISSTDAAMMTAYHLLADTNEPINQKILANSIVFIDPLQNPDGRERFTSRYYATVGLQHSADRLSAEHNEPWPNGRSNHYLFDMNRDWLAITQPETAGRIKMLNHYKPLVVIDLHEMGGDQSYYFAPAAQPFNPHMTKTQIENMDSIGRNHAKHFDRMGFDYFTREIFDAFYPGYGDSWPTFYGASASTYEVSSSRGEIYQRRDGSHLTYRNTVHRHFVASISTAEAVADNREKLLKDFYAYQVSAIKQGKDNKQRVYIMPNTRDRAGNHRLAALMAQHGVDVFQANQKFKACGKSYNKGAYFIDTAQPRGRFVTTTFKQQVDMDKAFILEQERRRQRNLNDEIYDVTGWSLPLMFNVDTDTCDDPVKVSSTQVDFEQPLKAEFARTESTNVQPVAFIVPWGDMSAGRFLTAALQQNLVVKSADQAFQLRDKQSFPAGSLIIERRTNSPAFAKTVEKIAQQTGAKVATTSSSWVTKGPNFGSGKVVTMSAPKIAMAWDSPVSSLSAGNTRFVIERQFNYPVTAIRSNVLANADLSNYQVIILPSGRYQSALGKNGAANLKQWVKQGGVLITLGSATRFAANKDIGILDVKRELAYTEKEKSKDDKKKSTTKGQLFKSKQDLVDASIDSENNPDFVAGVLANVETDQEHWLTAGINEKLIALVYGNDIYQPIKLNSGKNVAWFSNAKNVLASGYLWQENQKQLAYKPYLMVQPSGRGMVISFTQEPTTRAYLDGLNVLLMNSIFRAAAHATPLMK